MAISYFTCTTVANTACGVTAGTAVELVVVNVNSQLAPLFLQPGSNDIAAGLGYVETTAHVSDLMQQIPQQLFDIVFLNKGSITDYTATCGQPVC